MIRKLLSRQAQPETVLKSDYDALQARYDALVEQHEEVEHQLNTAIGLHLEVIEERNKVGTLLLDCLSLLGNITISKRQNSLIVERETLVAQAQALDWLPGRVEEQEESKA